MDVVTALREAGHEVYDFKNPTECDTAFSWSEIDNCWRGWTPEQLLVALEHPLAVAGFESDAAALAAADAVVLVLPCGRSAHLELGWALGHGIRGYVLLGDGPVEPELMYKLCHRHRIVVDLPALLRVIEADVSGKVPA